ncbi:sensor domain-containing diguanylate cyclase [Paenibacillus sp. y28]
MTGLVTLSVVLTLTMLLIASYQSQKQSLYNTTLTLNYSSASKMSQTMDSLFASMRSSLKNMAAYYSNRPLVDTPDLNESLEMFRNSSNYFNSMFISDENGIIRTLAPSSLGAAGRKLTTGAAMDALAQRKSYISKPYTTPSTGRLIVLISEPIFDRNGAYRGFIAGTMYLQDDNVLNMIFGNKSFEKTGSYFYVVNSDGDLLYHPDKTRLGENVSVNTAVHKLIQGQSGSELVVNTKGVTLLAGYSYVRETGWGIVVVSPLEEVNRQLNHHIRSLLFYTLFPFMVLMLVTIWLARQLARPFVSLANYVSRMGHEDAVLPETAPHWNREADLLTKTITLTLNGMKVQKAQLTHEAMTDALTGLKNRRTLEAIIKQWMDDQTPFCLIILDIDRFKSINDTYGHPVGDTVLQYLAEMITLSVRPGDVCSRYGGEEFVVLLPLTALADAITAAERIRILTMESENPLKRPVTVSLGVAHYPSQAETRDTLFHLADQALYKAKETGRNRTVSAEALLVEAGAGGQ